MATCSICNRTIKRGKSVFYRYPNEICFNCKDEVFSSIISKLKEQKDLLMSGSQVNHVSPIVVSRLTERINGPLTSEMTFRCSVQDDGIKFSIDGLRKSDVVLKYDDMIEIKDFLSLVVLESYYDQRAS